MAVENSPSSSYVGQQEHLGELGWLANMPTTKRHRKANYSREENQFLFSKYQEFHDIIDAKQKDAGTNRRKQEVWLAIADEHRMRFDLPEERTLDDLKNRLCKIKQELKECPTSYAPSSSSSSREAVEGRGTPHESYEYPSGRPRPSLAQQEALDLDRDTPGRPGVRLLTGVESSVGLGPDARGLSFDSEDEDMEETSVKVESLEEPRPPPSSTSKSSEMFVSASKRRKMQQGSFKEVCEIERDSALIKRDNALIKQQNLRLEQEKLRLQIQLLKQSLGQAALHE